MRPLCVLASSRLCVDSFIPYFPAISGSGDRDFLDADVRLVDFAGSAAFVMRLRHHVVAVQTPLVHPAGMHQLAIPHRHVRAAFAHVDAPVFQQVRSLNDADALDVHRAEQFRRMPQHFAPEFAATSRARPCPATPAGRRSSGFCCSASRSRKCRAAGDGTSGIAPSPSRRPSRTSCVDVPNCAETSHVILSIAWLPPMYAEVS